jgi:spermidine synthase
MARKTAFAVFVSGAVSIIAQTIVIREGMVMFAGNELTAGLMLAIWLVWSGLGSMLFARVRISKTPAFEFAGILVALSLISPATVAAFRLVPKVFSIHWGETIGFGNFLLISLILLCGMGICFGALFTTACRVCDAKRIYILEAAGACLGGLLISFVLLGTVTVFVTVLIVSSLMAGCGLFIRAPRISPLALISLLGLFKAWDADIALRRIQMPGQALVALSESKYGVISVTRTGGQVNFYTTGVFDFSFPDEYSAEEAVQYAMLYHPRPSRILLIGGGAGGCLDQVLGHPSVEEIVYAELDPVLFQLGEQFTDGHAQENSKIRVVLGDGRYYVKHATDSFDVVIVNLPDPVNGLINRYYTKEFFAETKRILREKGVLSVRLSAASDIISPLHAQYLKSVYAALAWSFSEIAVLPDGKLTLLATGHGPLPNDTTTAAKFSIGRLLSERIVQRGLNLRYVNDHFLKFNLTEERIRYARQALERAPARTNTDTNPSCYYYSLVLWSGRASELLRKILESSAKVHRGFLLLPLFLVLVFIRSRRRVVYCSVACAGATAISLEIVLIVLFQAMQGYLYGWIGAMTAAFMAGLGAGAYLCRTLGRRFLHGAAIFRGLAAGHAAFALFSIAAIFMIARYSIGSWAMLPLLLVLTGVVAGVFFPLALDIAGDGGAGFVYGFDLAGASVAAVATTVILIPAQGIFFTLVAYAALNAVAGLVLLTARARPFTG